MDAAERERRREVVARRIILRAQVTGRPQLPSALDVLTDYIVDLEERCERLEKKIDSIGVTANEAKLSADQLEHMNRPMGD